MLEHFTTGVHKQGSATNMFLFDRNGKGRKEKKIQRWLWLAIEENDTKLCSEAIRQGGHPSN